MPDRSPDQNAASTVPGLLTAGLLTLCALATPATAQFTDLQPGRNFPTAAAEFGGDRSENIEFGDVDNDGDLDAVIANGGDGSAQPNRIFINQGGLQAGSVGTFLEDTATRFLGVPNDTSRDIDFVDLDDDGDLDIYVANRGTTVGGGEVSRFYVNQGGLQGGTVGFYLEDTNARWGTLVSVPLGDQVFGGNTGPWRDYSCDCEFGDLDGDDDLDLFHSSYGPNINGTRDSRVFLNDGAGVFNELWPWADASADTRWHALDVDLVDLDTDFDLDLVVASRSSQTRIFHNNTSNPMLGATTLFTDTTQQSLLDTGATQTGNSVYETEAVDADGDNDLDLWMVNYDGFADRLLRNDGAQPGSPVTFTKTTTSLKGDPNVDENEIDFADFDGDGDLDAFHANFTGTNSLWASGLAQGVGTPGGFVEYHRTGTTSGGGQYSFPETPASGNGGTTLDAEAADVDNDGDLDLALANDANQQNRLWLNTLGIPDTHPPKPLGGGPIATPTGIDCLVEVIFSDWGEMRHGSLLTVTLFYSINYEPEQSVEMIHRGGGIFRGRIIAGGLAECVSYRIEADDWAGNTAVIEGEWHGPECWDNEGCALDGVSGAPLLTGSGPLTPGSPNALFLQSAAPSAASLLFVSVASAPTPFKGGTLKTVPVLFSIPLPTDPSGELRIPFLGPAGVPAGFQIWMQYAIDDAAAVQGVALSNAVRAEFP